MKDNYLKICEIFDSISGEGLHSGELATFIRFSGCNLDCSYCDTKYHNEVNEKYNPRFESCECLEQSNIFKKLKGKNHIVFTGGEPFTQSHKCLKILAQELIKNGTQLIEIETNGKYLVDFIKLFEEEYENTSVSFTADYKIEYSNDPEYLIGAVLGFRCLGAYDCIKVVVKNTDEIDIAENLADRFSQTSVIVSPCFGEITPTEIADYIVEKKYDNLKMQIQLHKYLWEVNAREK